MVNRKLFPEKSAKELLVQFRETGSQEPFEEIVRRYAAMVYGVALRVTGDKHDAEDATQAVFLSLALQAKTAREITYVGPWLQKVAHRLALDVKKGKTRRKRREEKLAEQAGHLARGSNGNGHHHNGNGHSNGNGNGNGHGNGFFGGNGHPNPADVPGSEELKAIMMEELNKLPAKYRMPLVLHYFGGLSREEMAAELGCNPSTLGVRVHRGKAMLGTRLQKRGVALSAVAVAVVLEHVIRSTTIQPLVSASTTASTAACLFAGESAPVLSASAKVIALARTVARSIVYAKMKVALVVLLVIASAALTTGAAVARYVDLKNLHLPSLRLSDWIRPWFKSWSGSPQANATPSQEDRVTPEDSFPSSEKPLRITVDRNMPGFSSPPLSVGESSGPVFVTPAKTQATATPAARTAPEPRLNATAQAILNPTLSTPPATMTAKVDQARRFTLGSDLRTTSERSAAAAAETDASTSTVAASINVDTLNIGAGGGGGFGGKPDVYTLPANTTLRANALIVGDFGPALFHQLGGENFVNGTLTIAREKSSVATYQLDAGTLIAQREIVGDKGEGAFIQTDGVNVADESIIIGKSGGGRGRYHQSGGDTIVLNPKPTSDPAKDPNGLHLGETKGSTGSYTLDSGSLSADPQLIGVGGTGTVTQNGGKNTTGAVAIAVQPDSQGTYNLTGGGIQIKVRPADKPAAAISIGGEGQGSFNLGNSDRTGAIYQVGGGGASSVIVRGDAGGAGSLRGWGWVNLKGALVNNDQVIADGFDKDRTLDLSNFAWVTSTIENSRVYGTSGWFARRKGQLALPALGFTAGTSTNTWGDDNGDPMIDMVNSARVTVDNAHRSGLVRITLVSSLRDDIPTLPDGHHFIGVWSFDGSDLGHFDGVDLQVRYDDVLAKQLGLDEELLKLWQYSTTDKSWVRINDDSFVRDTFDHVLRGHAGGDMSYFAVSAPEPGAVTLLVLATGAAMLRRRRRR